MPLRAAWQAFRSEARDLTRQATSGVFVRDMATQTTSMASVSSGGAPANGYSAQVDVSPEGRFVTFSSEGTNLMAGDTNRRSDVFIRDLNARETRRVSVSTAGAHANASCSNTAVSRGRSVLFECSASNLVTGDTNRSSDVFLRDVVAGVTTRVSTGAVGRQATLRRGEMFRLLALKPRRQ